MPLPDIPRAPSIPLPRPDPVALLALAHAIAEFAEEHVELLPVGRASLERLPDGTVRVSVEIAPNGKP